MHLFVLYFFIGRCWCDIEVLIDEKGGYNISINGHVWLRSAHTAIYADNIWYSSDDSSLPLTNISSAQGIDPNLGSWNETQLIYDLVRTGKHTKIVGHIRQWNSFTAVAFHLDTGDEVLTNTIPLDMEHVRTVFPSFRIEQMDTNNQHEYFTFSGKVAFLPL
jgi:hypothetical protein